VPAPVRTQFLRYDDQRSREVALIELTEQGFFSPCDDYDSIEVDLLKSHKLDEGEAEAMSQLKLRNADVLLIDEKRGRLIAEKEMRKVQGTASILAKLHRLEFVDYWDAIKRLRKEISWHISDRIAQKAFNYVMED
jgi:predicted nucleic acid-binding protein